MEKLVSMIIPVHNTAAEDFRHCFGSVAGQTYTNIEIIIVNDRSSDDCLNAIHEIIDGDRRTRLINSKNEGVSSARNTGVDCSSGEYVMFVDSDDFLNLNMVGEAVELLEKNQADMVIGRIKRFEKQELSFTQEDFETYDSYSEVFPGWNPETVRQIYGLFNVKYHHLSRDWYASYRTCFARLMRRTILTDLCFPEGIALSEDVIWNYQLLSAQKFKIIVTSCNWYAYIQHPDSVTHDNSFAFVMKNIDFFDYCLNNLIKSEEFYILFEYIYFENMRAVIHHYHLLQKDTHPFKKYMEFCRLCNSYPYNQLRLKHLSSFKNKIKYIMFRLGLMYPWYALKKQIAYIRGH